MVSVDVKRHVYLLTHGGLHRHLSYISLLLSTAVKHASFRPVDGTIESPGTAGRLGDELTLPLVNTITALNSSFLDTFYVNKDPPFPVYRLLLGHTNLLTVRAASRRCKPRTQYSKQVLPVKFRCNQKGPIKPSPTLNPIVF